MGKPAKLLTPEQQKLKPILLDLESTDTPLDVFFEQMEKEFGNYVKFSKLKANIENFYVQTSKMDWFYLLSQVNLDKNGFINLSKMMFEYSDIINKTIVSSKLSFYKIAHDLQHVWKCSTLNYVFQQNLSLERDYNVNEFNKGVIAPWNWDESIGVAWFKAWDTTKRKKIKIEDFIIVVDSYRDDVKLPKEKGNTLVLPKIAESSNNSGNPSGTNTMNNEILIADNHKFWIHKYTTLLKSVGITEQMAYETAKSEEESKEINISNWKSILHKIIPRHRVTAVELNNIADAFDVNNTKLINYEEYLALIRISINDRLIQALVSNKENTYPFLNYFSGKGTEINKLPLRENKRFREHGKKNKILDVSNDSAFISGTNWVNNLKTIESKTESNTVSKADLKSSQRIFTNSWTNNDNQIDHEFVNFVRQLNLFESSEWEFIEVCEDFEIANGLEHSPSFDFFNLLERSFSPTIPKRTLSYVTNLIDDNKDGYISNCDIIHFLWIYLNYKSSKLGWKEVLRNIIFILHWSVEEFFHKHLGEDDSMEVVFSIFIKVMQEYHNIEFPIAKKMWDELQQIYYSRKLTIGDIIYAVNHKLSTKSPTETIDVDKDVPLKKEVESWEALDKKSYEYELVKFVEQMQQAFLYWRCKDIKETCVLNLKAFLTLPNDWTMNQFREMFIKPLSMNYAWGIKIFHKLKKSNETHKIEADNLFNLLEEYIDENNAAVSVKMLVFYMENYKYPPLKLCFEAIPYNYRGISMIEFSNAFIKFYPNVPKNLFRNITLEIDTEKEGIISYKAINNFIFTFSVLTENRFSTKLMLCSLASYLDNKEFDTFLYLNRVFNTKNKEHKWISLQEHNEFFISQWNFSEEQSEFLFTTLWNVPNKNTYTLSHLITLIDQIRCSQDGKWFTSYQSTDQTQPIKMRGIPFGLSNEYTDLINELNTEIPFCVPLHKLSINASLTISVNELNNVLVNTYQNVEALNKSTLKQWYQVLDSQRSGYISYVTWHNFIKSQINNNSYHGCYLLHLRYMANQINVEFNGNWNGYLKYKGIVANKYVTQEGFNWWFQKDECLNDSDICTELFEFWKEKGKGPNSDMLYIQTLIDYFICWLGSTWDTPLYESEINLHECLNVIYDVISRIEDEGKNFPSVFDCINWSADVNDFGKINSDYIDKIYIEKFEMDENEVSAFRNYFCKVPKLFDLFKWCRVCQENSQFTKDIDTLAKQMGKKVPRKETFKSFCKLYNWDMDKGLNISGFSLYFKPIFQISVYDCFIIFMHVWLLPSNPLINELKVSPSFLFSYFDLLRLFKQEEIVDRTDYISPGLGLGLSRLAEYLQNMDDPEEIFKQYDKNKDKLLQRDEFMELWEEIEIDNLNIAMKVQILNYLDRNKDGVINYEEFLDFINNYDV